MIQLLSAADRAWWAFHCLPRDARGNPPDHKTVEASVSPPLPNGTLYKIFTGTTRSPRTDIAMRVAEALRVTSEWLWGGKGERPMPTGEVPSRARRYKLDTVDGLVDKMEAAGGAGAIVNPANPLEAAVLTLIEELDAETIRAVRAEFMGQEHSRPAHHWGRLLRDREAERRAAAEATKKKRAPKPKPPAPAKRSA